MTVRYDTFIVSRFWQTESNRLNAFKTMSMRIRGAKTELEEAGESTDGMAESTASLREEMLALSGVDIMLNENTFKSTYQIMDELSQKWQGLSDIAQASITELVAGKHQGNIMSSLMSNFDTARAALETSVNSSGSAMAEHAKWSESLEARLNKLKAAWQSMSQSFMKSDFLKGAIDIAIIFIDALDKIIDKIGVIPTVLGAFAGFKIVRTIVKGGGLGEFSGILEVLQDAFPVISRGAGVSAKGIRKLTTSLKEVSLVANGTGSAMGGFFSVIMMYPHIAIAAGAIAALTAVLIHQRREAKRTAEEVDKLTSDFKEQHSELIKGKSSFKSEAARYAQLSKGVDEFGRNISLTTDEYSEYQDVTNSIASQIPTLISGYDSQGNAILNLRDNAEELVGTYEKLVKAYEDLIEAENNKVLGKSKDIQKDFENSVKDANSSDDGLFDVKLSAKAAKAYKEMLKAEDIDSFFKNAQSNQEYWSSGIRLMGKDIKAMADLFEENGIERNGNWLYPETDAEYVKRVFKENKNVALRVINDFYTGIESETEGMKSLAAATISNAFDLSDSDFYGMNDTLKSTAKQIVNNFDYDFFSELTEKGISVEEYVNDMLKQLNALNNSDVESIEAAFNLQTKFNSGDVSYGEFIHGLEDVGKLVDTLKLSDDLKSQIKLSLGLNDNGLVEEYETLIKRITTTNKDEISKGNIIGLGIEEAKRFIDGLSAEELSVITDIIPKLDANATAQQIQAAIDREMAVRGLTFSLNLEVEAAGIETLNAALTESVSAAGLSSDSISALKSRYADLESEGYNLSAMFEETSNGIHLNRKAVSELENAYAKQKQNDIKDDIKALKKEYDLLTKELEGCNDASKRASLYVQRDAILKQINDAATLASQYEGLTSAYNDWLAAEEAGQERDMYEKVIEGFKNVGDEIKRGWLDDGTIKFLELLTGKTDLASKSGKELKEIYDGLGKKIGNSKYSVKDFFTVDADGNSTNGGVYNFLETIESFGGNFKKAIQRGKDGNIIGFNFKIAGGDEAIAKTLGISEELVQIMLRAADDAGFVVNIEGAWTQLANLKTEAETARDTLISLKKDGLDKLQGLDVNFDLNANGNDLVAEQEKALNLLEKFKKNGKIDLTMDGAQEALDIAEYLTIRLDDLTEPRFMKVDASTLNDELQEPFEKMQEIGRLIKERNLESLIGDPKVISETEAEITKIAEELAALPEETKTQIGIEKDWSSEDIVKAIETGDIKIPAKLDLDVQMSEDLKDMRLMMMNQLGLVSDEEVKLKIGYDIDDSIINALTEDEQKVVLDFVVKNEKEFNKLTSEEKEVVVEYIAKNELAEEDQKVFVEYIADGGDIEKFDEWLGKRKNIQIIAETFGVEDVDDLTTKLEGLDDKTIQAIAEAIGKGDVDALQSAIDGLDGNVVQAIAEALGYDDVESLKTAINNMQGNVVDAVVNTDGQSEKITTLQSSIWGLEGKTIDVVVNFIKSGFNAVKDWINGYQTTGEINISEVNGTANVNGTTGRAFKQGSWGTKNSGTALVGELGRETLVRDGKYYTIGDTGAEFIKYQRGDIIFNHRQTEELFKNGRVTSGGGRAHALSNGTAFVEGTAFKIGSTGFGGFEKVHAVNIDGDKVEINSKNTKANLPSLNGSTGNGGGVGDVGGSTASNGGGSSKDEDKEEFEETFDWIVTAIDRIEREIESLDKTANNVYKSWSERNSSLTEEIEKVGDEIDIQQQAYERYMQEAESIGLDPELAEKIRNGEIDIETITDEDLAKKAKEYETLYNNALNCQKAVEDLTITESELYAQRFENIESRYDGILQGFEHTESMINEYISQAEAQGHIVSKDYYQSLIDNESSRIDELYKERDELIAARDQAVADGKIEMYSEEWYNMSAGIDATTQAIEEANTAMLEYGKTMREIDWETFDLGQQFISDVTDESNFLIDLMSDEKLHDENGQLTEQGMATMGLHGQNYNTYMHQADDYAAEIAKLDEEIAKDPYNKDLINRRRDLVESQRECILAAEDEKQAMIDLVKEGIELELDAMQERIDKYNESIDAAKDLYEYQKNIKKQTKEIASLEKQIAAYSGDDSEESKAIVQSLKVSLEDAQENLKDTEYDKYISDQKALLDSLYLEYETILNARLDNVDALLTGITAEVNASATTIKTTLETETGKVGTTISNAMNSIWSTGDGNAKSVLTMYGNDFKNRQTTINTTLNGIKASVDKMVEASNKEAQGKTSSSSTQSSSKTNSSSGGTSSSKSNTGSSGGDGAAKIGDKVKFVSGQYYYDSQGTRPIGSQELGGYVYITNINDKSWATHPYHIARDKAGKHPLGWLKLNQLSGYATGKKDSQDNEIAWTQENGEEFIVRPSDGAILTPIARGDSVLTTEASNNIWNMANSPADFVKDNLNLGSTNVPNNSSVNSSYVQNFENIVFSMPNVQNYDEFISTMQKDKNFERLILSMTIDRIAGKSSLAKGKSIR